jgi:hypothetical protein
MRVARCVCCVVAWLRGCAVTCVTCVTCAICATCATCCCMRVLLQGAFQVLCAVLLVSTYFNYRTCAEYGGE